MRKNFIKAILAMALAGSVLMFSGEEAYAKDKPHNVSKEEHVVTKKDVDFYMIDNKPLGKQTTYFVDGNEQIPYFELGDFLDMRNGLYAAMDADNVISISKKGNNVVLKRENGYPCKINFKKNTIDFIDYNMFIKNSFSNSLIDIVSATGTDAEGNPAYLQRTGNEYSRYGKEIVLDLDDYDIDIIRAGKGYYVPLQTLLDIFMPSVPVLYNGESLFLGNGFFTLDKKKTGLGEAFYSTGARKRSKELAEYSYNELCLALDFHYGLKESQHIDTFKELFYETGLNRQLKSTNGTTADRALYELVCVVLGGGHNGFGSPSSYAGSDARYADGIVLSQSHASLIQYVTEYTQERMKAYPEGVPGYQEVGNTAYVTFDSFVYAAQDYYHEAPTAGAIDTVGLICYAHSQIMRENSPVENVVIDLSVNGGGLVDAAAFVTSWVLGESTFSIADPITGGESSVNYRCDANLDRVFDDRDTLKGKKVFCLTSQFSFSCANLVPCLLKSTGKATIIGNTSGGGACVVQPLSMADGTSFQVSSRYRISTLRNGAYIDVEQGAAADYKITDISKYYDREKLTNFVNSLY